MPGTRSTVRRVAMAVFVACAFTALSRGVVRQGGAIDTQPAPGALQVRAVVPGLAGDSARPGASVSTIIPPAAHQLVVDPQSGHQVVAGELVIVLRDGIDATAIYPIAAKHGGMVLGGVPESGVFHVTFPGVSQQGLAALADRIAADPAVEGAALRAISGVATASPPSDYGSEGWTDTPSGKNWHLEAIRAPKAWETGTGSRSVGVAIIDMGFYVDHKELKPNVGHTDSIGSSVEPGSNLKCDLNPLCSEAYKAHGDHVSALACGAANNGTGVVGVAWTCDLQLYRVASDSAPGNWESMALLWAMNRAIDNGAKVINISLGWSRWPSLVSESARLAAVHDANKVLGKALTRAAKLRPNGDYLFVIAAGNEGEDARFYSPASLAALFPGHVLVVAGTDASNKLYSQGPDDASNFGSLVEIAAPGDPLYSAGVRSCFVVCVDSYLEMHGSSMAAPLVAGAAALVWEQFPALSGEQVKKCLVDNSRTLPGLPMGFLDVANAVRCNSAEPPVIRSLNCTPAAPKAGETVTCAPVIEAPIESYFWAATGATPSRGDASTFTTTFNEAGEQTITVTVCNRGGCPSLSQRFTVSSAPVAPAAPGNLRILSSSSTRIDIAWADNSTNEDGFRFWVNGVRQSHSVGSGVTDTPFQGLLPGTNYCFIVRAFNGSGESPPSNEACATTPGAALNARAVNFRFFVARQHDPNQYVFSRDCDTSRPAAQFRPNPGEGLCVQFDYVDLPTGTYTSRRILVHDTVRILDYSSTGELRSGSQTFSFANLQQPGLYSLTLYVDGQDVGAGAVNVPAVPAVLPPLPPADAWLQVEGPNDILVQWEANSNNVDGYRIDDGIAIYTLGPRERWYRYSGLAPGTYKCVTVIAFNSQGQAGRGAGCVTTPGSFPPLPPVNARIRVVSANELIVEWDAGSNNAAGFRVEDGLTIRTVGPGERSLRYTGLQPGTYKCASVIAFNAVGEAGVGAGCATTPSVATCSSLPDAPVSLNFGWHGGSSYTFSWAPGPAGGGAGCSILEYQVLRDGTGPVLYSGLQASWDLNAFQLGGCTIRLGVRQRNQLGWGPFRYLSLQFCS